MAQKIYMVRMGQTMKEGTIIRWYKKDGESVKNGEDLYEIEYDKASASVQSTKDGILKIIIAEGQTVPVASVIGMICEPGEVSGNAVESDTKMDGAAAPADVPVAGEVKASMQVKRLARQMGIDIALIKPGDPSGRITEQDLERFAKQGSEPEEAAGDDRVKASPMAKRLAKENGVNLALLKASDPAGRISKEDVLNYLQNNEKPEEKPAALYAENAGVKVMPMSTMRRAIARNMSSSYFSNPVVTYSTDVDMYELLKLREQLNEELAPKGIKASVNDFLIKAAAKALKNKPGVNVSVDGETILLKSDINIGMAVALENGLVVPVVRNADRLKIEQVVAETKELIKKTREGNLTSADMSGGTFTITNLGMLGIDMFTPIINMPQSAILGVGRSVEKPVALNGEIVIRPMMVLSLTADHRAIDGALAAEFLIEIKKYIQKPFLLLYD